MERPFCPPTKAPADPIALSLPWPLVSTHPREPCRRLGKPPRRRNSFASPLERQRVGRGGKGRDAIACCPPHPASLTASRPLPQAAEAAFCIRLTRYLFTISYPKTQSKRGGGKKNLPKPVSSRVGHFVHREVFPLGRANARKPTSLVAPGGGTLPIASADRSRYSMTEN